MSLDSSEVKRAAAGRWPELLERVAGISRDVLDGKHHPCPKCGGTDRFRMIDAEAGALFCNQCFSSGNGDGLAAIQWATGLTFPEVLSRTADYLGLNGQAGNSVYRSNQNSKAKASHKSSGNIVATYDYRDADGSLITQAVRMEPKDFRQRKPKPGGGWDWRVKGCKLVPYRLPEFLADAEATIFIVEGEKDADCLAAIGLQATCNAGGAGKWKAEHASYLKGRNVAVLPDHDEAGQKHSQQVAASLHGVAASVKVVSLPGLPEKGDVSDWIDNHGDAATPEVIAENLLALVDAAEPFKGEAEETTVAPPLRWQPFPVDALPEPLASYVPSVATSVQVDNAMVALPALCAAAAAIGASRSIALRPGDWEEPCILWGAVVSDSGEGKSPAARKVIAAVRKRDKEARELNRERDAEYQQRQRDWELERKAWEKKRTGKQPTEEIGPAPEEPQPPPMPRFSVGDVTLERLKEILADSPRGVMRITDELTGLFGGFDKYSGGRGGSERSTYLSFHGAEPDQNDRKGDNRQSITLENPHLSIYGGIQPDLLHRVLSNDDLAAGLPARFLLAMPPIVRKRWNAPLIPEQQTEAVASLFSRLYAIGVPTEWSPDPLLGGDPTDLEHRSLPLTAEADRLFGEFIEPHYAERGSLDKPLRAAWSKLAGYCGRLALVIQLITDPASEHVDADSVQRAIVLTDWFRNEARRVYALRSETEAEKEERELIALVESKGGRITTRELQQGSRRFKKALEAELALGALVMAGLGKWETIETGGRPRTEFILSTASTSTEVPIAAVSATSVDVDRVDTLQNGHFEGAQIQ